MASSNVRSIDSLESFHGCLIELATSWDQSVQELKRLVHRAEEHFSTVRPAYWKNQLRIAEQKRNEALDDLARKRSAARAEDRPAATEAVKRVRLTEARVRLCEERIRDAKRISIEVTQKCDDLRGALANLSELSESSLPTGADELKALIDQLKLYAEKDG